MQRLDLDQLIQRSDRVDRAVDATPDIDPWCSSVDWTVPVHLAFAPDAEPLLLESDHGFALFASYPLPDGGNLIAGLEPLWGFACPLLGPDVSPIANDLVTSLGDHEWTTLAIPGIPAIQSRVIALARELATLGDVGLQEGITRRLIDLTDGPAAWLGRRSSKFRKNLRNAQRRGREAGLDFEIIDDSPLVFERIHAIEERSWKGVKGDGITSPEMSAFYSAIIRQIETEGRVRCVVATVRGVDAGYILGGVRGSRYRGLQLSYVQDLGALSLGHLLQLHEIHRMAAAGIVTYDMGMDMEYKQRMADHAMSSVMLVVHRAGSDQRSMG